MSTSHYSAATAETLHVETGSVTYAYRRLGPSGGVPLVLLHRFRGTLDWWDPRFIEGLAHDHDVIIFDNIGLGYTPGAPLTTMEDYARGAEHFIEALSLPRVDLLGWSFGGVVAQRLTVQRPDLVRKLVIAGSGSGAAPGTPGIPERVLGIQARPETTLGEFLYLFYPETKDGHHHGLDHMQRVTSEMPAGAPQVSQEAALGQLQAITAAMERPWSEVVTDLETIASPVLYAGGAHDVMIDAFGSYAAVQVLPNAKLLLYSDAGHAFLFQHREDFVREVTLFLAD